jgi:hypothetical protein
MKKPDRWERISQKLKTVAPSGNMYKESVVRGVVAGLLCKEHQAVLRVVREELALCITNAVIGGHTGVAEQWAARAAQCRDILAKLKARVK